MGHLWRWVSAKVADTEGASIGAMGQLLGAHTGSSRIHLPEVPVLAVKAIESARTVKDRQVIAALLVAAFAHPVGNAVGRQRIKVPVQNTFSGCACQVYQPAVPRLAQVAKTALSLRHLAGVNAKRAIDVTAHRRCKRQLKLLTRDSLGAMHGWLGPLRLLPEAIGAGGENSRHR